MLTFAEYIWIDGSEPVQKMRSKTRVVEISQPGPNGEPSHSEMPIWNFDGSSTNQAPGDDSECILKPVALRESPFGMLGPTSYLVLCEVMNPDGSPHVSNQRAKLRLTLDEGGKDLDTYWGFEQEYCLVSNKTDSILGWPNNTKYYPAPQGQYYCGVGADEVAGRNIVIEHAQSCLRSKLLLYGTNAEVMLGQWEFQIGYRGFKSDITRRAEPLRASDDLWFARYILYRTCEKYNTYATLTPKPKQGDWNGSGMHTNFSDLYLRSKDSGKDRMSAIEKVFKKNHKEHQNVYGTGNKARLTGKHETAHYNDFSMGVANRGASIRIPNKTQEEGYGYLEDRRPAANADPYVVANRILKSLLEIK